jgi:predicted DCC family thiol-disulfide oxidoreductase YuxK
MEEAAERYVILYDGLCGLCNRLNRFVIERDFGARFQFASLQSDFAELVLRQNDIPLRDLDTLYVARLNPNGSKHLLSKASAVLFILSHLASVWRWSRIFRILPMFLLDSVYDVVARHRYRLFGKYEYNDCPVPPPEHRDRFIDVK